MKKTINELKNEFLEEYGEKANKVLYLYNVNPNLMRYLSEICKTHQKQETCIMMK